MIPNSLTPNAILERLSCAELAQVIKLQCAINDAKRAGHTNWARALQTELGRLLTPLPSHPAILACKVTSS